MGRRVLSLTMPILFSQPSIINTKNKIDSHFRHPQFQRISRSYDLDLFIYTVLRKPTFGPFIYYLPPHRFRCALIPCFVSFQHHTSIPLLGLCFLFRIPLLLYLSFFPSPKFYTPVCTSCQRANAQLGMIVIPYYIYSMLVPTRVLYHVDQF